MGAIAGYFRGSIDTVVSRITEITMAFPALLFIIALASTVGDRLDNDHLRGSSRPGVVTLVAGLHASSAGSTRRGSCARQVLSLREKEFVEAARMVGASDWRIIRSHLLPHLVAPIIVFSTLIVAQLHPRRGGLSFLGLGIKLPTRELGQPARGRRPSTTSRSRG